jgi:pimeloyl-ACP methyl ester carboxylesterase
MSITESILGRITLFAMSIGPLLTGPVWAQSDTGGGGAARPEGASRPWYELGMMADPILDQVLLFYLSEAWEGMTDVGEVLETASRVRIDDPTSWSREWLKTAERVRATAEMSEKAGHRLSAGEAYLRASSYYRATLHRHLEPTSPEVRQITEKEVAAYTSAIRLLSLPAQPVRIPYEGTTLPAYFFRSPVAGKKAPLLIVHQGRDAWAEDCTYVAQEAVKRGWHCLLVDGPGMGKTIRLQGLPFRADWEKVITPVVDFVLKQPGVDPSRIALMGISMGGVLAPRAAAFEKRLKLLIANPGVYDWSRTYTDFLAAFDPDLASLPEKDPEAFNQVIAQVGVQNALIAWGIKDSMWRHGAATPAQLMAEIKKYTLRGLAERITAKTLVIDGEAEEFGQAKELYDALKCPKDYMLFTAAEAAQLHVQTGSLAVQTHRVFDWLEDNL